jgi:hypothetical protein
VTTVTAGSSNGGYPEIIKPPQHQECSMTNTQTDITACIAAIALAVAVATVGIRMNLEHVRATAIKTEQVAESGFVRHSGMVVDKRMVAILIVAPRDRLLPRRP